jgi:acetyl-CoA acetyltransferase
MSSPVFILGRLSNRLCQEPGRAKARTCRTWCARPRWARCKPAVPDAAQVQSIHVGNAFGELQRQQAHLGAMVAQVVPELWGVPAMRHEGACASSSLAVLTAMAEIEAGRYDCVLVLGAEEFKNTPGDVASVKTRTPPPGRAVRT